MPAQKRSSEHLEEDSLQRNLQHQKQQEANEGEDSDGSLSSISGDKEEFVSIKLSDVRREVQCPICLGIIRKTRTVMECLHRFCRECIDKSMRLGNNECPACRTHCASRRSLRDDPNYDKLIAALYPDIDLYEEEELAFHDEEKTRNKQIQASIAQTLRRQEAISRRRTTAKATAAAFVRRSSYRNLRGRKNGRGSDFQGSDDEEDANGNGCKYSSSAEERSADVKQRRCKRWAGARFPHTSSASANADGGCDENELELNRENTGATPGLVGNPEGLVWGRGGTRSHTRHGNTNGGNGKHARSSRICKMVDYLRSLEENDNELEVHLWIDSMDEQSIPSLERPYLCCSPTLSVRHLCQYVALQTPVQAEELEIVAVKGSQYATIDPHGLKVNHLTSTDDPIAKSQLFDPCKDELQILEGHETVAALHANCNTKQGILVLAYRHKVKS